MAILKQVADIDVAHKELVVSLGRMDHELALEIFDYKDVYKQSKRFQRVKKWAERQVKNDIRIRYVMEATGVYHESLAYYLTDSGEASVVLPNKVSNFFRTLDLDTITDKTASEAIIRFGLERKLEVWQKPKKIFRELKQLTRERDQLIVDRTVLKNQLHAKSSEAFPNQRSISRINKRTALYTSKDRFPPRMKATMKK